MSYASFPNRLRGSPGDTSAGRQVTNAGGVVVPPPGSSEVTPRTDPWLSDTYYNLPNLRSVVFIPHFGGNVPALDTFSATNVRAIYCSKRDKEYLAVRLYQALTSTHFEVYVNPARSHPERVEAVFEYGVMYFRIPRAIYNPGRGAPLKNACFLMTGVACYSHLCTPFVSTINHRTIEDRRIGVYPVEYEYQRTLSYFGTAANKHTLRYSFSGGAFHFATRTKEFSGRLAPKALRSDDSFLGLHSLGDQNDALFNVVTRNYPQALNFGCFVPVFDARQATFVFNEGHFHTLASLPLFSGEVPHGAMVTVGYTTCIFHELHGDPTVQTDTGIAMFFVQFVVLHSL